MMTFRTYRNSRSETIIGEIIKNENLDVNLETCVDALGDDIIEAHGDREDIEILKQVYNMVK